MISRKSESRSRSERARRLHEEAGSIDVEADQNSVSSPELHDEAGLAYLMDLILNDEAYSDIAPALKRMSTSGTAMGSDARALSKIVQPFADRLYLLPQALGLMLVLWGQEADNGGHGIEGLDDWLTQPSHIQEKRKAAACDALELSRDLDYILTKLNERPDLAVALARKKSVLLTKRLDLLEKSLRGEVGRRKRIFYDCSRRDLKAFFLTRIKHQMTSSSEVLELFNEERLDLSVQENRAKKSKYVSGRVSKVARMIATISPSNIDEPDE